MLVLANILQPLVDVNEAIINWFHDSLGFGWGASIIGLTVVVRLAILPLTFRQVRGMQAMQRLAPEMKKIQERYKEDKQRQQQELMRFYQEHNFNPLSSCLPLLLQLPFFISLYQLQRTSEFKAEVRGGGGQDFLFIKDLTEPATGGVLVVLILVYIATQLGSSLVTMINAQDKNQRRLMLALPFFFAFIIVNFQAGLVVYWITTNVWTIGQQLLVKRFLPPPEPVSGSEGKKAGGEGRARTAGAGDRRGGSDGGDGKPARREGILERAARAGRAAATGDDGKSSGGGAGAGNGGPAKAPPPSPRKKKKRSGRRR
ncbi:MAG TPA: YidC/Oxa1 family membrane protein insertase [Thermoleophilaceae bacterium]